MEQMDRNNLLEMTADIVAAHVSNNTVGAEDLTQIITSVYSALASAGEQAPSVMEKPKPAVSVRASIKQDAITCFDCGFKGKMLKRHLRTEHNLTPQEYKTRWGLAKDYPMVAPAYAQQRKELAVKIGLGRKPGKSAKRKLIGTSKKVGRTRKAASA